MRVDPSPIRPLQDFLIYMVLNLKIFLKEHLLINYNEQLLELNIRLLPLIIDITLI